MTTPAGWYTDPSNPARYRYWDGAQWTEHVHPPEGTAEPAAAAVDAGAGQAGDPFAASQGQPATAADAAWQPAAAEAAPQAASFTDTASGAVDIGSPAVVSAPGAWGADNGSYQTPAPAYGGDQPAYGNEQPAYGNEQPAYGGDQPVYGTQQPAPAAEQPGSGVQAPAAAGLDPYAQGGYGGGAAAAGQPMQYSAADGVGGIRTELLSDPRYGEVGSGERVTRQNSRLLKVVLGPDVLARQGSMVAFQGRVDFDHEGAGAARFLKKALTGEGLPLMRCTGQGELFLADGARNVHIIWMDNAGLSVNGRNVLAFEPSLEWDIERVQGASMLAGGLFNTRLRGSGWVAITTKGDPVVLRTDQPTFVDTDAVVAWSAGLQTSINRTMKAKALIGKGSGEAAQLAFAGQGIVIVQPSEGDAVPPHTH